jgi:hypothetical protein
MEAPDDAPVRRDAIVNSDTDAGGKSGRVPVTPAFSRDRCNALLLL